MKKRGKVNAVLPLSTDIVRHYLRQGELTLALEALIHQYQGPILRYCSCLMQDEEAKDVTQDIFLTAFEKLSCLRDEASINAWLYGIATNKCLERRRNSRRREALHRAHWALIRQHAHCAPPPLLEETSILESQRCLVWMALQRLQVYERQLVVLRYLEGLVYEDIAQILRVSSRTVERHLPRALTKFCKAYGRCQRHDGSTLTSLTARGPG